jgi:putative endonuclease
MTERRLRLGRAAEAHAQKYLVHQGLTWLTSNWRMPRAPGRRGATGELDLLMRDGDVLVVVEVRAQASEGTARGSFAGAPEHTVGPEKRARIARATQCYLTTLSWRPRAIRFDVVALTHRTTGWDIRWIKRAFEV